MDINPGPKANPKNTNKFMLLAGLLIVCLILLVLMKNEGVTAGNIFAVVKSRVFNSASERLSSVQFEPGTHPGFVAYGNGLVCAKEDGIKIYNIQGQEEWSDQMVLTNPLVKADGNYMVAVDLGGKNVYAYHNKSEIWNKTVEGEILTVSVDNKGYVGVVCKDKSLKNTVRIFNRNGMEVLNRYCFNNYVVDVKVQPDLGLIAIGEVDASSLNVSSGVRLISFDGKNEKGYFEEDSIFQCMEFVDKDLEVGFDKKVINIKPGGEKTLINDFGGQKVTKLRLGDKKLIIKAAETSGFLNSSSRIEIMNKTGKTIGDFETKKSIANMDARGDIIAANTGDKVLFINTSGKQMGEFVPRKDVKEVKILNDGLHAAVIYIDSLDVINIY